MQLFNFDHTLTHPREFNVGPFAVSVKADHCSNLKLLPRRASQTYDHDATHSRRVRHIPANRGEFLPTATISWSTGDSAPPSVLFPDVPGPDSTYDLVLLLSFLTGRRVYVDDELEWDPRRSYGERILSGEDLIYFAQRAWDNLPRVAALGLSDALSCLVQAPQSPDLIGWGAYVNAALESVVTAWSSANGRTRFHDAALIKDSRAMIKTTLLERGVSKESVEDIIARFNQIGSPSAITKIKWFLEGCGLFPSIPTDYQVSRLRRLNVVRNAIAHSGTVRIEEQLGAETSLSVAATVILLTQEIAELYIARDLLGVDTYSTRTSIETIKAFFEDGEFRGQKVFHEKYEDYLSRLEKSWVEDGVFEMVPLPTDRSAEASTP